MSIPNIITGLMLAVIYGLMGPFVRRWPETLSAYSMMQRYDKGAKCNKGKK